MTNLIEYINQKYPDLASLKDPIVFSGKPLEELFKGMDITAINEFKTLKVKNIIIKHEFHLYPPFNEFNKECVKPGDLEISGIVYVPNYNSVFFK